MRLRRPALLRSASCAAGVLGLTLAAQAPRPAASPAAEVARAEQAFAQLALEKGIPAAFLTNLAPGSVVLRPGPVDARTLYAADKDPGLLIWRPAQVGVAASGELAYSTGPWEYRPAKDAAPVATGHFLSIWARQADGGWKVAFDAGVPHPARPEPEGWTAFLPAAPDLLGEEDPARTLQALDRGLSSGSARLVRLAFGATVYRRGRPPLTGAAEVAAVLQAEPDRAYEPAGARVARSGELGYTWGTAGANGGGAVSYLHLWVRGAGVWRLLYDLELPMSVPKP
ncbi:MAG TPA: nuclear transport factor 2 family protein [Holophagaceae bacterium]|nr:nuclear transport factor 2 family protein [Holophagaceae bacterium]